MQRAVLSCPLLIMQLGIVVCDAHLALSCCSCVCWAVKCSPCKHAAERERVHQDVKEEEAADLAAKHLVEDEERQQAKPAAKQAKKQRKKAKQKSAKHANFANQAEGQSQRLESSSAQLLKSITIADLLASVQRGPNAEASARNTSHALQPAASPIQLKPDWVLEYRDFHHGDLSAA